MKTDALIQLKVHDHDRSRELNTWFHLNVEIPGYPSARTCTKVLLWRLTWLYELENVKLGTPTLLCIFLLYSFKTDVNVIILKPHTSSGWCTTWVLWWHHDLFGRKVYACSWSTGMGIVTLSRDAKADALDHPFYDREKWQPPGTCHDTLPQVPWCAPKSSQPGFGFVQNT